MRGNIHGNMPITPEELNIPREEVDAAMKWWCSLSLNDWKEIETKHNWPSYQRWSRIHSLWVKEGKPI